VPKCLTAVQCIPVYERQHIRIFKEAACKSIKVSTSMSLSSIQYYCDARRLSPSDATTDWNAVFFTLPCAHQNLEDVSQWGRLLQKLQQRFLMTLKRYAFGRPVTRMYIGVLISLALPLSPTYILTILLSHQSSFLYMSGLSVIIVAWLFNFYCRNEVIMTQNRADITAKEHKSGDEMSFLKRELGQKYL
jgi:hypothetical protein